jgi:hypothetical protein
MVKDHLGNKYNSMADMAEAYGLTRSLLSHRLCTKRWTLEQALTTPKSNRGVQPQKIEYNGKIYNSRLELARDHGVTYDKLMQRMKNGDSLEIALVKRVVVDHLGNEYKSYREMAQHYGVSYHTFMDRRNKGWDIKSCLLGRR